MIHKIIDSAVPDYILGCALDHIMNSEKWNIVRSSSKSFSIPEYLKDPSQFSEVPQPTIGILHNDTVNCHFLHGYTRCIFDYICHQNGIVVDKLERIFINANYKGVDHDPHLHIDSKKDNYQSIVFMITPNMTETGLMVDGITIPYAFNRAVWFDSKDKHGATPLLQDHALPRLTIAYIFRV